MNIERTKLEDGEFSPSGVGDAKCPRLFYLNRILKLKPKRSPVALAYGTAIHAGVETFYKEKSLGALSFDDILMKAIKSFADEWVKAGLEGDKKRNLDGGLLTINGYCNTYRNDTAKFIDTDVEGAQWVLMPNGTTMLMKMDRLEEAPFGINITDTKTTASSLTDWYFRQFESSLQMSLYQYGVEQQFGTVSSIVIDAIKVPFPSVKSKTEAFSRQSFIRSDMQIEDAVRTYCKRTDYVMHGIKDVKESEHAEYFYCNQEHCNDYDGCPYQGVCKHGLDHPSVMTDFTIGD